MPSDRNDPPFVSRSFCDGVWYVDGHRHDCLKPLGHNGACWCCDHPGGDLTALTTETVTA